MPEEYAVKGTPPESRDGELSGITFDTITIAAPSVIGEPQLLTGHDKGVIKGLTFKNVTVGGKPMTQVDFKVNEFVESLRFPT